MTDATTTARRGRAARRARRAAPLPPAERPIRPGLPGGRFLPLGEADMERIHRTALDLLERVGLADPIPSMVERVSAAGGRLTEGGRLVFPRALVEDVIARTRRGFVLSGQTPDHDMTLEGTNLHLGTGGAAPSVVDLESGRYRDATLADVYDIARLVDRLDNIHFVWRSVVACDVPGMRALDLNTAYACMQGTTKHIGSSFSHAAHVEDAVAMFDIALGGEGRFRERPFCTISCCFVVPPMRFAEDACAAFEAAVRLGMPVLMLAAGQAGATSPAALAGAVVQAVAEVLSGLVWGNLLDPEARLVFGPWPFVSDLRTGAMSGGSGEQAVLMAACAQMANFYDVPCSVAAGMTDAKVPDAQSGGEKGYTVTLAAQAGANMVHESAGMHASLLGACYESFVIDNDLAGSVLRAVRGIEVTDETLSLDVIAEVTTRGPGHYLGHDQTLDAMEHHYHYPEVGCRRTPAEWEEGGARDVRDTARDRARQILASHYPDHVAAKADERIRERFEIHLPRALMRPRDGH